MAISTKILKESVEIHEKHIAEELGRACEKRLSELAAKLRGKPEYLFDAFDIRTLDDYFDREGRAVEIRIRLRPRFVAEKDPSMMPKSPLLMDPLFRPSPEPKFKGMKFDSMIMDEMIKLETDGSETVHESMTAMKKKMAKKGAEEKKVKVEADPPEPRPENWEQWG